VYVEDVFSTYLYTGDGATQTITNNIDLSTKGGLVWIKSRTTGFNHTLVDTVRGATNLLVSNTTAAQATQANSLTAFTSTGFSIGAGSIVNYATDAFVSWTFRKQKKFFDVVTYTGNGSSQNISHNLGSVPGCIIVKRYVGAAASWLVYHRSASVSPENSILQLNLTDAVITSATPWNATQPTDTVFSVGNNPSTKNASDSYVAYLFAHDAGGFGLAGTDNVISCGSFTHSFVTDSTVTLGYEPQFVLLKDASSAGGWKMYDTMRGASLTGGAELTANTANAESAKTPPSSLNVTATGFVAQGFVTGTGTTIYIAIRRGPMKVPTVGTSVFSPVARTGTDVNTVISGIGFATDLFIGKYRGYTSGPYAFDRLRGVGRQVKLSDVVGAEQSGQDAMVEFGNVSVTVGVDTYAYNTNNSISTLINYFFGRAPQFFDIVVDQGTGAAHTVTHNLKAAPELILRKARDGGFNWNVYYGSAGNFLQLSLSSASAADADIWNNTAPTSSVFSVGGSSTVGSNWAGSSYISYLFATCAGVSKVGTYTGNGSNQTIACGFAAGSRFVLIKRINASGDWYVWDSARGIVAGNDPHISFNSEASEVTTDDSVDTDNSGFIVNQLSATDVNVSSAVYIFLAIA
jgi:hypothetical protein